MDTTGKLETGFCTLPTTVQLHIVKFIKHNDIKSARMACIKWFRMVHPPSFELADNDDQILELLKNSFHYKINKLQVVRYNPSLPIYSSTRLGIPKAYHLVLSEGNSAENVKKLIRYYAKSCNVLTLGLSCFGKILDFQLKGLTYEFLNYLKINVETPSEFDELETRNHLNKLKQFLQSVRLPGLQKLNIDSIEIFDPTDDELALQAFQSFNHAMETFLARNGQRIINLIYNEIPLSVVKSFKYLSKLEELDISFNYHLNEGGTKNEVIESLASVKKLKILKFSDFEGTPDFHYEILAALLSVNGKSLKEFQLHARKARTDWLPVNSALELKILHLSFQAFSEANLFSLATIRASKLEHVRRLWLFIDPAPDNWQEQIIPWIIATCPNLRELILSAPTRITTENKVLIIRNLCNLVQIFNYHRDIIPDISAEDAEVQAPKWVRQDYSEEGVAEFSKENGWLLWSILIRSNDLSSIDTDRVLEKLAGRRLYLSDLMF